MKGIINFLYFTIRRKEVRAAQAKLNKIKISGIMQNISKTCWNYSIKDEIIIKNENVLIVKLTGDKKTILLKYHKTDMADPDAFESLFTLMQSLEIDRAVYIATGSFDKKIHKYKNIKSVDGIKFIRGQLGLSGRAWKRITRDKICFAQYMPF
jgi:hypothetical protein